MLLRTLAEGQHLKLFARRVVAAGRLEASQVPENA